MTALSDLLDELEDAVEIRAYWGRSAAAMPNSEYIRRRAVRDRADRDVTRLREEIMRRLDCAAEAEGRNQNSSPAPHDG